MQRHRPAATAAAAAAGQRSTADWGMSNVFSFFSVTWPPCPHFSYKLSDTKHLRESLFTKKITNKIPPKR